MTIFEIYPSFFSKLHYKLILKNTLNLFFVKKPINKPAFMYGAKLVWYENVVLMYEV